MDLSLIFSILAVAAAAFSVFSSNMRSVILSAWVVAMSVGALFLCFGAEYLAIVQWIVGTLVAISFFVFSSMFGEYGVVDSRSSRDKIFDAIPAILVGGAFFFMLALAIRGISISSTGSGPAAAADLAAIGEALEGKHVLSLELLGFLLLVVLIGAGVVSRPEESDNEGAR